MEEFKNLKEIIELSEEEINNNDENVSAVLDLIDLKELRNLIARYKELEECLKAEESYSKSLNNDIKSLLHIEPNDNFIPKSKVIEKIEELRNEYKKISKENFINKNETQKVLNAQIIAYKKLLKE